MGLSPDEMNDALGQLEERIREAAELLSRLRQEKNTAVAGRDAALKEAAEARNQTASLLEELESLRAEREQVRSRIEKLLGQVDLISAS